MLNVYELIFMALALGDFDLTLIAAELYLCIFKISGDFDLILGNAIVLFPLILIE